jgi:hypothetical protein
MEQIDMFLLKRVSCLAILVPVVALAGCQHMSPKAPPMGDNPMDGKKHSMRGDQREDKQRKRSSRKDNREMHKEAMSKACDGHALGDATTLQTPRGELKGQCQLMFVPDQPPADPQP